MSKKEKFIEEVRVLIEGKQLSEDAMDYFNALQETSRAEKAKFTENGKKVLQYMQENKITVNNLFKAKDIGEGLFISSRGASGALRKLVTDGYAEKIGQDPVVYSLTESGSNVDITLE